MLKGHVEWVRLQLSRAACAQLLLFQRPSVTLLQALSDISPGVEAAVAPSCRQDGACHVERSNFVQGNFAGGKPHFPKEEP